MPKQFVFSAVFMGVWWPGNMVLAVFAESAG
jgi:hypothetical protein